MTVCFLFLDVFIYFIFTFFFRYQTGFLEGHQANGAFVACGPPGFTALALINLADRSQEMYVLMTSQRHLGLINHPENSLSARNLISPNAGEIWYAVSVLSALLLFGLAVFFFAFGALPYWFKLHKHLGEVLGCMFLSLQFHSIEQVTEIIFAQGWALTFPNGTHLSAPNLIGSNIIFMLIDLLLTSGLDSHPSTLRRHLQPQLLQHLEPRNDHHPLHHLVNSRLSHFPCLLQRQDIYILTRRYLERISEETREGVEGKT